MGSCSRTGGWDVFFPPIGLIAGPFLGAVAGELIAGKDSNVAFRSGLGSFIGFVAGTVMKLVISLIMGYYFVMHAFFMKGNTKMEWL
jgi:uncharacterized protein